MKIRSLIRSRAKNSQTKKHVVFKKKDPSVRDISTVSVRTFCSKRSVSAKVATEKVTEIVMDSSSLFYDVFERIHVDFFIIF